MPPTPLNILSLDGGGVRGLSSLYILKALMEQLQKRTNSSTVPSPCEVFDVICGTSTGGLMALMLGRLRMGVDDAIRSYEELSKDVFGKKPSFPALRTLMGRPMYDASVLEERVKKIADHACGNRNAPLEHPLDEGGTGHFCHTFVLATYGDQLDRNPRCLRSYPTSIDKADACMIWQAARATTAVSSFFSPIKIGPERFIDETLEANNPSRIALAEVATLFPGRQIGCFLSLGSAIPRLMMVSGSLVKIVEACTRLSISCEKVDHSLRKSFRDNIPAGQENPYFRFSANGDLRNIMLDEWKYAEELAKTSQGYLRMDTQESKVEKIVDMLVAKTRDEKMLLANGV